MKYRDRKTGSWSFKGGWVQYILNYDGHGNNYQDLVEMFLFRHTQEIFPRKQNTIDF
jgi:hypothetical protein